MNAVVLVFFIVAFGIGGLVAARRRRNAQFAAQDVGPGCGKCGYSTLGLERMVCPECGGDLREVGILAPSRAVTSNGAVSSIVAYVMTLMLVSTSVGTAFEQLLKSYRIDRTSISLAAPGSSAYQRIEVIGSASRWTEGRALMPVKVMLVTNLAATATMDIDVSARRYQYLDSTGQIVAGSGRVDDQLVLKWMAGNGINTADGKVMSEAQEIAIAIQRAARIMLPRESGTVLGAQVVRNETFGKSSIDRRRTAGMPPVIGQIFRLVPGALLLLGIAYVLAISRNWQRRVFSAPAGSA